MLLRALFLLVLAAAPAAAEDRPAGVVVDAVAERELRETAPILGRIVAATRAVVAARTPGIVAEASARVGQRVRAGAPLARIDTERLVIERSLNEAALQQARGDYEATRADVDLARQALDRISGLRESSAFSIGAFQDRQAELARATSRLGAAAARVESAEAALASMDYDLKHAVTRAPFDGVVLERTAQPGAYLSLGAPVATLLDVDSLEIEADAPTEIISALSPGLEVEALLGETVARATLRAVVPEEAVSTRTRPVRFVIDGAEGQLAQGQSVTLMVPTAEPRSALTVSKDALTQGPRGWTVFVAEDGVAQPRSVEIGLPVGDRYEVISGVAAGDWVVVRGNERLRPGQPVEARTLDGELAGPAPSQG